MKRIKKILLNNKYLSWLLIVSNWAFQGIINADKTEKTYKIFFTVFFWALLFFGFQNTLPLMQNIILSFLIAHTFNWLFNGSIVTLFIHRLLIMKVSKEKLFAYLISFQNRIQNKKWVLYSASFGSICRGKLKDSSDIDVSIVRKSGFVNGIKAIFFTIKEKKIADFKGIPLEIYISDTPQNSINRFKKENNPVVITDSINTIDVYYNEKLTINEAKKLNKVL